MCLDVLAYVLGGRAGDLEFDLHGEFQVSQGYIVRPCLKIQNPTLLICIFAFVSLFTLLKPCLKTYKKYIQKLHFYHFNIFLVSIISIVYRDNARAF